MVALVYDTVAFGIKAAVTLETHTRCWFMNWCEL